MLDVTPAFSFFPVLETERLILRSVTFADVDSIFRIMSNPHVIRYFGQLPMHSQKEAVRRVEGIQEAFETQRGIRWAITHRETAEFLGSCGFWRVEKLHHRAEIGYELAPEYWGQGVMTEALGAVITFGFRVLGLHSVEAQIHPANTGSRRVLEKLGFIQEGYFHENYYDPVEARFTDTVVFSLLKAAWLQSSTE
jgi:ribosomal-protein-alanine N-acetyltransferase